MDTNKKALALELTPGTLEKKGIAYAPRTLASLVYMDDGTKVSDVLEDMITDGKRFILRTKTELLTVQFDRQRIYEIPTPLEKYNFDKFPLIVSINNTIIESTNYTLNNSQLILSEQFSSTVRQGDILTFIFHYLDIIIEDKGINAESINNIRFYVDNKEPKHKKNTDVWFDTLLNQVKQFDGEDWNIIVNGSGGGSNLAILKSSTIVNNETSVVEIGINDYNSRGDLLFVYLNSTYLEEGQDYTIDENNMVIHNANENWNGTRDQQIFNFIVFKNIAQSIGSSKTSSVVLKSNITINNETSTVEIGIDDYDSQKDTLFVYLNSIYLEQGQDYSIEDNRIIRKISGNWDGVEDRQIFNFIVFKNITQSFIGRKRIVNINDDIGKVELQNISKEINLDENNPYIPQLFNIIKDCQSTIISLKEKIERLEKNIQR